MPTEAYRFPDFLALLPQKPCGGISPHFKEVETAFSTWMEQKYGGPLAEEVYKFDCPLFVALTCPLASYQQLMGNSEFTAATILLDDLIDCSPTEDLASISQLWMDTLGGGSEAKGDEHSCIEMMRSRLSTIRAAVGSFHWCQFIAGNEEMVTAMVQEARDQKASLNKDTPTSIQSYIMLRRGSIAAGVYWAFVRSSLSLYIPDNVLASPVVQELEYAAADLTTIPNDIYSFKKEYSFDGGFSNILTVMQKDPETAHLDFQERLDYTGTLFKTVLERFQVCRRELPSFGPQMDQYLAQYADALINFVAGNVEWSRAVPRYNMFTNDEDRRNNILRLALDGSHVN